MFGLPRPMEGGRSKFGGVVDADCGSAMIAGLIKRPRRPSLSEFT